MNIQGKHFVNISMDCIIYVSHPNLCAPVLPVLEDQQPAGNC